jgi:hypothetical protein
MMQMTKLYHDPCLLSDEQQAATRVIKAATRENIWKARKRAVNVGSLICALLLEAIIKEDAASD